MSCLGLFAFDTLPPMEIGPNKTFNAGCPEGGTLLGVLHGADAVFSKVRGFYQEFADFRTKLLILRDDCEKCARAVKNQPKNQFWRRTFVRNLFAYFEGVNFGMKQLAIAQYGRKQVDFLVAELAMLREEKYGLDDKGRATSQTTNYPKFIQNTPFAFECLARSCQAAFTLDNRLIPDLKQFEHIRNRLTHPKRGKELDLSDGELGICSRTFELFVKETERLFSVCDVDKPANRKLMQEQPKINLSEPYAIILPNGNVFGFRKYKLAKNFVTHLKANGTEHPLFIRAESFQNDSKDAHETTD